MRAGLGVGVLVVLGGLRTVAGCVGDSGVPDSGAPDSTAKDGNAQDVTSDTVTSDAPAEAGPSCNLDAAFAQPVELLSLNVVSDAGGNTRGVHLSPDLLIAYYQYGAGTLYTATRPTPTGDTFTSPQLLSSLELPDASVSQGYPSVTSDLKTIYFSTTRSGISQIYFATRATSTDAFGAPAPVTGLPPNVAAQSPFVQGDGSTLYFQ